MQRDLIQEDDRAMPVCSYLIHPAEGRGAALAKALNAIPGCEATRADNHDLLILVTDTASPEEGEALEKNLNQMKDIQCLTLTFGQIRPDRETEQES